MDAFTKQNTGSWNLHSVNIECGFQLIRRFDVCRILNHLRMFLNTFPSFSIWQRASCMYNYVNTITTSICTLRCLRLYVFQNFYFDTKDALSLFG